MTILKYGLIGCGMMGQEHIRNIQMLENAEIACICEPDEEMQAHARALAPGADIVSDLDAFLQNNEIDCIVIVSPNHLHAGQVKRIVADKPRPILVEKPLVTDPADFQFMTELQKEYPLPVWVAMEYRYMPPIAAFMREVQAATGGIDMLSIREHRFPFLEKVGNWNRFNRNSGGTFVEKCCHFFDLMRLITGSEPVRVMASAGQSHNHLDERYAGETPDIWDNGFVIVDFESGARGMLELCMFAEGAEYQEEITAIGINGKIDCLVPGPGRFWPEHLGAPPTPKVITSPRQPKGPVEMEIPVAAELLEAGDHNGATFYQHQRFQKAVLGQGPVEVTLNDGMMAVAMGVAAQESARTGKAVDITA